MLLETSVVTDERINRPSRPPSCQATQQYISVNRLSGGDDLTTTSRHRAAICVLTKTEWGPIRMRHRVVFCVVTLRLFPRSAGPGDIIGIRLLNQGNSARPCVPPSLLAFVSGDDKREIGISKPTDGTHFPKIKSRLPTLCSKSR